MRKNAMHGRYARLLALSSFSILLWSTVGCGPEFFTVKGTVSSSGGNLGQWAATPSICSRNEFDGDSSRLVTMTFGRPDSSDPDRALHRDSEPNWPLELQIAKNGKGYMGKLTTSETLMSDGTLLDGSNCRTFTFDRTEHWADLDDSRPSLNGELVLDCMVKQNHITADLKFKKCD